VSELIDDQRIAIVGFSLSGASAMRLAGARLELEKFPASCETHDDGACEGFRPSPVDGLRIPRTGQRRLR
jgi:predicted dienelactone hydrolase